MKLGLPSMQTIMWGLVFGIAGAYVYDKWLKKA